MCNLLIFIISRIELGCQNFREENRTTSFFYTLLLFFFSFAHRKLQAFSKFRVSVIYKKLRQKNSMI